MKLKSLNDLLVEELKDLYNAETQLTKALPRMAKAASSELLRSSILMHLDETHGQIDRLERAFRRLDASPRGKKCKAMEGLIAEAKDIIDANGSNSVRDAALIAAAQKVEHYEIAGYGTVRTYAEILGLDDIAGLLQESLDEEGAADKTLTSIAKEINLEAELPAVK